MQFANFFTILHGHQSYKLFQNFSPTGDLIKIGEIPEIQSLTLKLYFANKNNGKVDRLR